MAPPQPCQCAAADTGQRREGSHRPAAPARTGRGAARLDGRRGGYSGLGFSYSKRAGGPALFAHARELAPELIGEEPADIGRLWESLLWAGASVGRSGLAVQAIAAYDVAPWDMKAPRAALPLARLLGAHRGSVRCYNTSGGFLSSGIGEVVSN